MKPRRPPAARAKTSRAKPARRTPVPAVAPPLQYKVVELSTVDETALELAVNAWVPQGWAFDGVQFAMRESSKRPAMAFLFFTRASSVTEHDAAAAHDRLRSLAEDRPAGARSASARQVSAHERLAQLAGLDAPEPRLEGRLLGADE